MNYKLKTSIMKKLLLGLMMLFAFTVFAQSTHTVDFEPAGVGADWIWIVGENADNPPLEFVANPFIGGINTSATTAKFTARLTGNPWALCFTDSDGQFTFDAANSTITMMVYKPVISDVGFKVEGGTGTPTQIVVANTMINTWEELTFDFSAVEGQTFSRLVIIPDFDFTPRTQENIVYFDNIQVPDGVPVGPLPEPTVAAPTPVQDPGDVISMFSDAYTDVPVDTWLTVWSQGALEDVLIAGNATKKYTSVTFVGVETTGANLIDASAMTHFHMDVWSPDANDFKIKLVDFGPDLAYGGGDDSEHEITFPAPATETWISYDIPLTDFTGLASTMHLAQLIMVKAPLGTLYVDNVFYYIDGILYTTTFYPQDGANNVPASVTPTLTFSVPVVKADETPITNGDIPSLISFKETDAGGADVSFTGTIDAGAQIITVSPTTNLNLNQVYYLAINNDVIKYQGGNLITEQNITFTTESAAFTLPVTFEANDVNYGLGDFGGNVSSIVTDPTDPLNTVVQSSKGAETWAGTTLLGPLGSGLDDPIPFALGYTHMSIRVWSPTAGTPVRFKVENGSNAGISVETEVLTTISSDWETLIFDFSNEVSGTTPINYTESYSKPVVFFNFGAVGTGEIYYWDDVEFIGALTYRISGNVYYGSTGTTKPMETNTTVFLDPVANAVATGPLGYYEFTDNLDGAYVLRGETTKPGNNAQITTADGIIASRMAAGLGTYTTLQFRAVDVNMSNAVTTSDAILVKRKAAGLTVNWAAPLYVFDGPFGPPNPVLGGIPVTVSGGDVEQVIRCLLSGDVNSSYTPPAN